MPKKKSVKNEPDLQVWKCAIPKADVLIAVSATHLQLGRFPVRDYDAKTIKQIKNILKISLRDRKLIAEILNISSDNALDETVFYNCFLDVFEKAPWFFDVFNTVYLQKFAGAKQLKKDLSRRIWDHALKGNGYTLEDKEDLTDEQLFNTEDKTIAEIFLFYISTLSSKFLEWLANQEKDFLISKEDLVAELLQPILDTEKENEIQLDNKDDRKEETDLIETDRITLLSAVNMAATSLGQKPTSQQAIELSMLATKLGELLASEETAEKLQRRHDSDVKGLIEKASEIEGLSLDHQKMLKIRIMADPECINQVRRALDRCHQHKNSAQQLAKRQEESERRENEAFLNKDKKISEIWAELESIKKELSKVQEQDPLFELIDFLSLNTPIDQVKAINKTKSNPDLKKLINSNQKMDLVKNGKQTKPPKTKDVKLRRSNEPKLHAENQPKITLETNVIAEQNPLPDPSTKVLELPKSPDKLKNPLAPKVESATKQSKGKKNIKAYHSVAAQDEFSEYISLNSEMLNSHGSSSDLNQIIASLLDNDQLALAARFSAAATRSGVDLDLDPKVLIAASAYQLNFDRFTEDVQEFSAIISEAQINANALESAILFSSLLKPAVLRNETSARSIIQTLTLKLGDKVSNLQKEVGNLGYEFSPTVFDLQTLSGTDPAVNPQASANAIIEWRDECLVLNVHYKLVKMVLKSLLSEGELAILINDIQLKKSGTAQRAHLVLAKFATSSLIEDRIREIERGLGSYVRRGWARAKIQHQNLDWLLRVLQNGLELIQIWVDSIVTSQRESSQGTKRYLPPIVQRLRKAARIALDDFSKINEADGQITISVQSLVQRRILSFDNFLSGKCEENSLSWESSILAEIDLLPAGCEPRKHSPLAICSDQCHISSDLLIEDRAVIEALISDGVSNPYQAFQEKLEAGAFSTAARLVKFITSEVYSAESLKEDIREAHEVKNSEFIKTVKDIQRRLKDLSTIDLKFGDKTRQMLEILKKIEDLLLAGDLSKILGYSGMITSNFTDLPSQHYEVPKFFHEAETLAEDMLKQIRKDQMLQLEDILVSQPQLCDEVIKLKDQVHERNVQTVDDQIAQLAEGLPISLETTKNLTPFYDFYPHIVEKAQTGHSGGWPNSLKDYQEAFDGKAGWPEVLRLTTAEDGQAASLIMETWFKIARNLSNNSSSPRVLEDLLRLLGVTNPSVKLQERVPGVEMFRHQAEINIDARGWFLPPIFGSKSGGIYKIYTCTKKVVLEQIEAELTGRDQVVPKLIFILGNLSVERRVQIADIFRKLRLPALVIDETLMAFVAQRSGWRLPTLFACATPFAFVQPYTTDAGRLPKEIFFGRDREIEQIVDLSADGTLVYGGRQLGKSALLHHVEGLYHSPDDGFVVLRRDVTYVGRPSDPAETVWMKISEGLADFGITKAKVYSATEVVGAIKAWLDEQSRRRVLVLLDETDNFMSSEARNSYPNLTKLKELMEMTQRRFKIVFAGLHNVRRMLEAPNSPLHHLGAICVGPLTRTIEDKRSARSLVVEPLRASGYQFENEDAVSDILAFVSHYPSLIQVFMKELVTTLKPVGDGPLYTIKNSELFRGESFVTIQAAVRERFNYTLDLDPRFKLIAATLAQLRYADEDFAMIQAGLPVDRIRTAVRSNWPKSLQTVDEVSFRHLLDEMVDLGVLSVEDASGKHYRLRTNQITQMIGSLDEVEEIIMALNEREANVDYDAGIYRRRYKLSKGNKQTSLPNRCPLVDSQITALLKPGMEARIVIGLKELGLGILPGAVEAICGPNGNWDEFQGLSFETAGTGQKEFRRSFEKSSVGRKILFVKPDKRDAERLMKFCEAHSHVLDGRITPIFLLDAQIRENRDLAIRRGALALRPWGHQMLRAFLEETELTSLDSREIRNFLLDKTGGLPEQLVQLCLQIGKDSSKKKINDIQSELKNVSLPTFKSDMELSRLLEVMIETDTVEDYQALDGILNEIGEDLRDSASILEMLGMIEKYDPTDGVLRLSRLAHLVKVTS